LSISPWRDALQTIGHFISALDTSICTVLDSNPVHMLLDPRARKAAYATNVLSIAPVLFTRFNMPNQDWHPATHSHLTGERLPPSGCPIDEERFTPTGSWIIHNTPPPSPVATDDDDVDDSDAAPRALAPNRHTRRARAYSSDSNNNNNPPDDRRARARDQQQQRPPIRRRRLFRPASSSPERYTEPDSPSATTNARYTEPGSPSDYQHTNTNDSD
jgi:hypothetical protein